MRAFLVFVALVLIFAIVGWIKFSKGPDRASINLETGQIRQDTSRAMESGGQLLHKAGDKMESEANHQPVNESASPKTAPVTK